MYTDLHFTMTNLNTAHKREGKIQTMSHCQLQYVENDFAVTVMTKWKLSLTTLPDLTILI